MSHADVASICGVAKTSVIAWEKGAKIPGEALAALMREGLDVFYILVGRSQDAPQPLSLTPDEVRLVDDYRSLTDEMRAKVLGYLQAAVDLDLRRGTSRTLRRPEITKKKPAKKK